MSVGLALRMSLPPSETTNKTQRAFFPLLRQAADGATVTLLFCEVVPDVVAGVGAGEGGARRQPRLGSQLLSGNLLAGHAAAGPLRALQQLVAAAEARPHGRNVGATLTESR